jgi:tRNA G26 N,N-dimethylase Trm1
MDLLNTLEKYWQFIVVVTGSGGIAGLIKYYYEYQANRKTSIELLYEELEKLKLRVIIQISKEVEHANELSEKNLILLKLKEKCPDCYQAVIDTIENNKKK